MPYKIVGTKVMHKKNGKWSVKQVATSVKKAEATVRLLQGVEHGMKVKKKKR